MRDCAFVGNGANSGGAMKIAGGPTDVIERCAFHGNTAGFQLGAVSTGGTPTITNSTISGNLGNQGGGILMGPGTTLNHVTIFGNNGRGLATTGITGATINLQNSIIAGNSVQDCAIFGPVTTLGNNIAGDGTCGLTDPTDHPNTDPLLAPLAPNGGLSVTHRTRFGSPAIDAVVGACSNHDQRNLLRPADGDNSGVAVCDIGAFEQQFADCDGNGVFDPTDIDDGTWPDENDNGVPDICEIPGDMDGNGIIDLADQARFARCLGGPGDSPVSICTLADTDGDGDVDLADFAGAQGRFRAAP